jgi:hypothetical protein
MSFQNNRPKIIHHIPTALYPSDRPVRELAFLLGKIKQGKKKKLHLLIIINCSGSTKLSAGGLYFIQPGVQKQEQILNFEHAFSSEEEDEGDIGAAIQQINDSVNLYILPSTAKQSVPRKKPKRYYIRKNPLPRILKRDFRRDFITMYQNVVNSQEPGMIESFFITFAVPSFHIIVHNPMLACFGLNVIQQRQGLQAFIPECVQHFAAFADLVLTTEKAHIVQIEGDRGSKIVARFHGQASRMMIPNPSSVTKLEHFFCTCAFFDRQKLELIKSAISLRAGSLNADLQQFMTLQGVYSRLQESLQSIPAWISSNTSTWVESISNLLTPTTNTTNMHNHINHNHINTSTTTHNHSHNHLDQLHETNIPVPTLASNMFSFIDVEVLLQQMQLFYKSFQPTTTTSNVAHQRLPITTVTSTSTASVSSSVTTSALSDLHTDEQSTNKRKRKRSSESTFSSSANINTNPNTTPSSSSSSSSTSSSCPHFFNFKDEPLFEICQDCGRNKFPHAATLQALAKPFLLRVSVHPIVSFYFNEQNRLYRIEAVVPLDQNSYSMDLPASSS